MRCRPGLSARPPEDLARNLAERIESTMPQDSNLIKAAHAASLIYRNEHRSTTLRQCIARAADYHGVVRGQLTVYMTLKMPILEPFIAPTGKLTQMSLFEESV